MKPNYKRWVPVFLSLMTPSEQMYFEDCKKLKQPIIEILDWIVESRRVQKIIERKQN